MPKIYPTVYIDENGETQEGSPCEEYFSIEELADIVDEYRRLTNK